MAAKAALASETKRGMIRSGEAVRTVMEAMSQGG